MWKTNSYYVIRALTLWSGIWLALSALLEFWHRGFVVHYVNTRYVWLLFGVTGMLFLVLKNMQEPQS